MALQKRITTGGAAILWVAGAFFCNPGIAESNLCTGVVWYTQASDAVADLAAQRYQVGVTGTDLPSNKIEIKTQNPDFRWFVYNSGTDNYVPPYSTGEHEELEAKAAAGGWSIEDCYLHYYDDTEVVLQGDTLFVPGWGAGSAVDPADARIPVYNANMSRRVANFSVPHAAQAYREEIIDRALANPFQGSTIYPDGIFLDNSSAKLFNYGKILSGGHVREAPGNPSLNDPAFQDWHWNQSLGPFLASLKDTLQTSPGWSPDGQRKYLMINVADVWNDSYCSLDVTDVLFMEFQYNPVRNFGLGLVDEAYRRDALAADAGITCFYPATMTKSYGGSSYSYADVIVGNLAWYLTTRTANSIFFEFANATPHVAGWDTLTWRGIINVCDQQLGQPLGAPYTISQGTDPMGNSFVVKARTYEGGLSVIRNRGRWDEGIEPGTAVSVTLPTQMIPLNASGQAGTPTNHVSLRNGEGAIFLSQPVDVPLTAFTAEWDGTAAVLRWQVGSASAELSGFRVHRENAAGDRVPIGTASVSGGTEFSFVDPAPVSGARYWLEELTRSGGSAWYGPAVLSPGSAPAAVTPRLAQNRPNPCRSGTSIHFTVDRAGPARLTVFDVGGREVARLFDGMAAAGDHEASWDGRTAHGSAARPGVYFYRLETVDGALTRKMTVLP